VPKAEVEYQYSVSKKSGARASMEFKLTNFFLSPPFFSQFYSRNWSRGRLASTWSR
jgi:hypothetical protein